MLVFTGQHSRLDPGDYGLGCFPLISLDSPALDDPHAHVGTVTRALLPLLASADLVIVQGDTSSALGGALAAVTAGAPLAHVEAGLRSHDRRHPWPEEEFRVAIDSHSDLLFAPTELSAANLRRERVRGRIHVTGNSGVDSVLRLARPAPAPRTKQDSPRLLVTCHRRESWGDGLAAIAGALRTIAQSKIATVDLVLHPNLRLAAQLRLLLGGQNGLRLHPPLAHADLINAMLESELVLSDSGGIQEEAATLGIPLLVLRERTERPEAIATGQLALAGVDSDRIVQSVQRLLRQRPSAPSALQYGREGAGKRIAAIIHDWLSERRFHQERARPAAENLRVAAGSRALFF